MQQKWLAKLALVVCASMVLAACGNNGAANDQTEGTKNTQQEAPAAKNNPEDKKQEEEKAVEKPAPAPGPASGGIAPAIIPVTVADLEGNLTIGASKEAVIELAGEDYQKVTSAMDGSTVWRFDIGAKEGYLYEDKSDSPDLEGLKSGEVILQIFVGFDDEGKVSNYTAYQRGENETVHAFYTFENGQRKDEKIE
jgi:hypothetical protein